MATGIKNHVSLLWLVCHVYRAPERVISLVNCSAWVSLGTRDEMLAHVLVGKHSRVFDTKGLEDVLLEVVVELQTADALHADTCPVDVWLISSAACPLKDGPEAILTPYSHFEPG